MGDWAKLLISLEDKKSAVNLRDNFDQILSHFQTLDYDFPRQALSSLLMIHRDNVSQVDYRNPNLTQEDIAKILGGTFGLTGRVFLAYSDEELERWEYLNWTKFSPTIVQDLLDEEEKKKKADRAAIHELHEDCFKKYKEICEIFGSSLFPVRAPLIHVLLRDQYIGRCRDINFNTVSDFIAGKQPK